MFESQEELKWNPIMPFLITVRPSSQVVLSESWPQIRDWFIKLIEVDTTWNEDLIVKNNYCTVKHLDICTWGEGWWWWGTVFNRLDHVSPWVAACCQATKEIGFVVGEKSFQWLYQLRWIYSSALSHHKFLCRTLICKFRLKPLAGMLLGKYVL